eukprot:TRINITY_DN5321_c0_g1_i3.p1 TRINITY_DN5321_c0_g1~~TRINITY_DN5321_c0_g1_i3.p1  ORF type:complete len:191 (-),score=56.07 TRINITY_DN5321_c0_g1_i3:279-851(-)
MTLKIPPNYPADAPDISLQSIKNVPKKILEELEASCREEAQNSVGDPMIFVLTSIIKGWLDEHNEEVLDLPLNVSKSAIHIDESEYKEGTPVTVETFQAWWGDFIRSKNEANVKLKNQGQLTGKAYFQKMGSTAIVDDFDDDDEDQDAEKDEEVLEEGQDTDKVDWEVFVDEGDVDLDELDMKFSDEENQ